MTAGACSRRAFVTANAVGGLNVIFARNCPSFVQPNDGSQSVDLLARLHRVQTRHPRLHLDGRSIADLRNQLRGRRHSYSEQLLAWVDRNQAWNPLADNEDRKFANTVLEEEGAFITNLALTAVLTERDDMLALARRRTLETCVTPIDRYSLYSLGMYVASLARAYDWLYESFSVSERATIRSRITHIVSEMFAGSVWGELNAHWWSRYPLHHDYWIPAGGFGEASLALLGEVEQAPSWAVRAKELLDESWSWLGDDGSWHEGVGDWCYAVAPMLTFYSAWKDVVGDDLHDRPWIRNTARYRLYHWLPDGQYIGLNDSFRDGRYGPTGAASCHLLRRLASLFRDGHAQWLADQDEIYDLRPGGKGVQRAPHEKLSYQEEVRDDVHADGYCHAWNVLWYDETVAPRAPDDLPLSAHLENSGVVIARTAWTEPDATVLSLACGPLGGRTAAKRVRSGEAIVPGNVAHAHADYNSITLFAAGEYCVIPPGYARRSSRFQNTVAVNGADFLVDPGLNIDMVAVTAEDGFAYAVGDASRAFPAACGVDQYRRHCWMQRDGRIILFDQLRLTDSDSRYWDQFQWTLHSDPRTHRVTADGPALQWFSAESGKPVLKVHVLEPEGFAWEHARLHSLDGSVMLEAHRLVRPEWYLEQMHVVAEFTTDIARRASQTVIDERWLAVRPATPDEPTVAFARQPIPAAQITDVVAGISSGGNVLLFGHNPDRPGEFHRSPSRVVQ